MAIKKKSYKDMSVSSLKKEAESLIESLIEIKEVLLEVLSINRIISSNVSSMEYNSATNYFPSANAFNSPAKVINTPSLEREEDSTISGEEVIANLLDPLDSE